MSADFFPSERWRYTMTEYLGVSSDSTNKKGIFTDRESAWIEEYIHARSGTVLFPLLLCLTLVNCSEFLTPVVILPSRILAPSSCLSAPSTADAVERTPAWSSFTSQSAQSLWEQIQTNASAIIMITAMNLWSLVFILCTVCSAVYPEIFPCYPKHLISIKQNGQGTHYTYRLGKYCCNGSSGSINCIDFPSIFPWVKSVFFLSNVYHPFMFCVYCVSEDLFAFPLIWNCEYKL